MISLVKREASGRWRLVRSSGHLVKGASETGEIAPSEFRTYEIRGLEDYNTAAGNRSVAEATYNVFRNGTGQWGTPNVEPSFIWANGSCTGYRSAEHGMDAASTYANIPAYKFSVPAGRTVVGVRAIVKGSAALKCGYDYMTGQSRDVAMLSQSSGASRPDDCYVRLAATAAVGSPWLAATGEHASVNIADNFTLLDKPYLFYYNTAYGINSYLPIANDVPEYEVDLPASAATVANANGHVWITLTPAFSYDDPANWDYWNFDSYGWFATYSVSKVRVQFLLG